MIQTTLLSILLQADALPTNLWTVGGMMALFAGVIAYLFKLYDSSQEKRLQEMKGNLEGNIVQLRNDLNDEKVARRNLQEQMNNTINGQLGKNNALLESVNEYLKDLKR